MNLLEWMEKTLTDNEELRKKIIDSYDSRLKDIFTEDEVLAILDADDYGFTKAVIGLTGDKDG